MNLGWIGCGNMGVRMAERIVKAGYKLNVYNRTPEKTKRVLDAGDAVRIDTPAEIAACSDIIFTSITNDAAMREVLYEENRNNMSKALENSLTCITSILATEAVLFCKKANIDRKLAVECLGSCHGASVYFKNVYKDLLEGHPQDSISLEDCRESIKQVLTSSMNNGLFAPITAVASQQLNIMHFEHGGDAGLSEIII